MPARSPAYAIAVAVLALTCHAAPAAADCKLGKLAEIPVTLEGLAPIVPAAINGVQGRFLLDTGAFYSTLTRAGSQRVKLKVNPSKVVLVQGVGGEEENGIGVAQSFAFGGVEATGVEFLVGGRRFLRPDLAGLIGQNVLGSSDVEFDLANGVVRFFKPMGCEKADLGYWAAGKAGAVPLEVSQNVRQSPILATVEVQGRPVKALFDTGAWTSFLSRDAAQRLGLKLEAPEVQAAGSSHGVGAFSIRTLLVPVTSFALGGETVRNTRLRVGDGGTGEADMLIGADFFLSHRIYVSKAQRRLYFTYNGGPVFRLDAAPSSPGAALVPAPSAGLDAEGLKRRAAASAARGDPKRAEEDLAQAIALDAKSAELFIMRAGIRLRLGREADALADYGEALKLAPDDAHARLAHGEIALRQGDVATARADFDRLAKTPGETVEQRLSIAGAWALAGRPDDAERALDAWIAAHPGQRLEPPQLVGRCRVRAAIGRRVEEALADCNAAIGAGLREAGAFDSRGLAKLRLGRWKEAAADYDLAIKAYERLPDAHYGRGLARRRAGDAAGAEADFAAAKALDPGVAGRFKAVGLEP